jgi:hypothetical protein
MNPNVQAFAQTVEKRLGYHPSLDRSVEWWLAHATEQIANIGKLLATGGHDAYARSLAADLGAAAFAISEELRDGGHH